MRYVVERTIGDIGIFIDAVLILIRYGKADKGVTVSVLGRDYLKAALIAVVDIICFGQFAITVQLNNSLVSALSQILEFGAFDLCAVGEIFM